MNLFFVNILLFSFLSLSNGSLFSKNFIGLDKSEINEIVSNNFRSYKLNTSYVNKSYNYLKYEDKIREITLLFFLNEDDTCKMIRIMSDYSNLNDLFTELESNYSKVDNNNWQYIVEGVNYNVLLEEGDWFFTVSIKEKK